MTDSLPAIDDLLHETRWVARVALALTGDVHRAADLEQDAWLAALSRPPAGPGGSPRAWLATVLRRAAGRERRGAARRARREMIAARDEAEPSVEAVLGREDERRALVEAVLALAEPARTTLVLRFFEELPAAEVARSMGVPASTVRTRLRRGLAELRARFERERGADWRAWCATLVPAGMAREGAPATPALAKLGVAAVLVVVGAGFGWRAVTGPPGAVLTVAPTSPADADRNGAPAPDAGFARGRIAVEAVDEAVDEAPVRPLPLPFDRQVAVIRALVLDGARAPIAGATVSALAVEGRPEATSDETGRVELVLDTLVPRSWPQAFVGIAGEPEPGREFGGLPLLVRAPGHAEVLTSVNLRGRRIFDAGVVVLPAGGTLQGRVLGPDGPGLAGVRVGLAPELPLDDPAAPASIRYATLLGKFVGEDGLVLTDAEGHWRMDRVPVGAYVVCAWDEETATSWATAEVSAGEVVRVDDFVLELLDDDERVEGVLLDETGLPVAGTWVSGRFDEGDVAGGLVAWRRTRDDGRFVLPAVPGWRVWIAARCGPRALAAAGERGVVLRREAATPPEVGAASSLTGTVVRDGAPVPGAIVRSGGFASLTDDLGRFLFDAASGDAAGIVAEHEEEGVLYLGRATGPARESGTLLLPLQASGTICGAVLANEPRDWTGTRVDVAGPAEARGTVGSDGRFRVDGLLPGEYQVALDDPRFDRETSTLVVEVAPGEAARVEFDRRATRGCRLVGRLTIGGASPRGTWRWSLRRDRENDIWLGELAADGAFEATLAEPGARRWQAVGGSSATHRETLQLDLEVAPGENRLELDVPTGLLTITGLTLPEPLELHGGEPELAHQLEWEREDGLRWTAQLLTAEAGRYRIERAPAGRIRLRVRAPDDRKPLHEAPIVAEVEVRRDEEVTLELEE